MWRDISVSINNGHRQYQPQSSAHNESLNEKPSMVMKAYLANESNQKK
jgi:hypothetical protein